MFAEQIHIVHFAVGVHLLLILSRSSDNLPCPLFRRFQCNDAHRSPAAQVDKRCRHFAPVAKLQRSLAQPAARHHADCVRGAAVDLDVSHQPLAVAAPRLMMPRRRHPSMAMRTPSTCPAQRCPCAISAWPTAPPELPCRPCYSSSRECSEISLDSPLLVAVAVLYQNRRRADQIVAHLRRPRWLEAHLQRLSLPYRRRARRTRMIRRIPGPNFFASRGRRAATCATTANSCFPLAFTPQYAA